MYLGRHVQCRYSCQILMKIEFSRHISKHAEISDFMKIRSVGAELFHRDEWTDRLDELLVTFRNFANAPEN
jgi:hypothetical protein